MEFKKNAEIILIVPIGVSEAIFPWGVHFIQDFLVNKSRPVNAPILDFRSDTFMDVMNKKYGQMLGELFLALTTRQMTLFLKHVINPLFFAGILACMGDGFFDHIRGGKALRKKFSADLQLFQDEMVLFIKGKLTEYKNKAAGGSRIWAFSVYDYTMFNSLYITKLLKQVDPEASVIMGGDYFDFNVAPEILKSTKDIDGIVVGYGEEVLRKVLEGFQQGTSVKDLKIPGLVNSAFLTNADLSLNLSTIQTPAFYFEKTYEHIVNYAYRTSDKIIHVLTQRGCSWGKCAFCTQLDKEMLFRFPPGHLIQDLQKVIQTTKFKMIDIVFDSDENNVNTFIELIKFLENYKSSGYCFQLFLWLQVKSFNKDLADTLSKINSNVIRIQFDLNFESLNFETLKNMKKGHSPIKAIESAKVLLDCGQKFTTNYFNHYPLETWASVKNEVDNLKKCLHLLMPPKAKLIDFPYSANNRDSIFHDQKKFNVVSKHIAEDGWMKASFGLDIPFSFWAYTYNDRLSFNFFSILSASYYRYYQAMINLNMPRDIAKSSWGITKFPASEGFKYLIRFSKMLFWKVLHGLFSLVKNGGILKERTRLLDYLSDVDVNEQGFSQAPQSHFFIKGNILVKDYNAPGYREKFNLALPASELKLLRTVYYTKQLDEIKAELKPVISETELDLLLVKHIKLGSIIQYRTQYLSTVNDPEYWLAKK